MTAAVIVTDLNYPVQAGEIALAKLIMDYNGKFSDRPHAYQNAILDPKLAYYKIKEFMIDWQNPNNVYTA